MNNVMVHFMIGWGCGCSYTFQDKEERKGTQRNHCEFNKAGSGRLQFRLCVLF